MKLGCTSTLPSLQDPTTLHIQCLLSKVQLWQSRHITPVVDTVCPILTISVRHINIKAATAVPCYGITKFVLSSFPQRSWFLTEQCLRRTDVA